MILSRSYKICNYAIFLELGIFTISYVYHHYFISHYKYIIFCLHNTWYIKIPKSIALIW